jgi:hypothetical protein
MYFKGDIKQYLPIQDYPILYTVHAALPALPDAIEE